MYYSLQPPRNDDYDAVKGKIMARVGLSPVCVAQLFHQWRYEENTQLQVQAAKLTGCILHREAPPGAPELTPTQSLTPVPPQQSHDTDHLCAQ